MFLRNSEQPYDFACHFIDVVSDYSTKAKTLTFIQFTRLICRECGLMDKAPDFGSGDCRFESCHSRNYDLFFLLVALIIKKNHIILLQVSICFYNFSWFFSLLSITMLHL